MADQKVVLAIRITDPNVTTQQAAVDSLGRLNIVAVGNRSHNTAVPLASGNLGTLPSVATALAPSYSEGFQTALSTDLGGALRVNTSPHAVFQTAGPWTVSGTVSALQSGVWNVGQTAGPWTVSGTVAATQSGVWNVGQTAGPWTVSGTVTTNPHAVFQTAGPWAISGSVTTAGSPVTTPVMVNGVVAAVAVLATGSVTTGELVSGATYYLWGADFTSSIPFKVVLEKRQNGVGTTLTTLSAEAAATVLYRPPDRNFIPLAAAGPDNKWAAYFENLDASYAGDCYVTFYYGSS